MGASTLGDQFIAALAVATTNLNLTELMHDNLKKRPSYLNEVSGVAGRLWLGVASPMLLNASTQITSAECSGETLIGEL